MSIIEDIENEIQKRSTSLLQKVGLFKSPTMEFKVGQNLTPIQNEVAQKTVRKVDPYVKSPLGFGDSMEIFKSQIASEIAKKQGKNFNQNYAPSPELIKEALNNLVTPVMGATDAGVGGLGGFTKAVDDATKREMMTVVDYLRNGTTVPHIEDTISKLSEKFGINQDVSNTKLADTFQDLIEKTKTTGGQMKVNVPKAKSVGTSQTLSELANKSPQDLQSIPPDVSSYYNLDRLNVDNEAKTAIQNEIDGAGEGLRKTVGSRLSNKEVIDLATSTSKVINKTVTREQTASKIASNLRLRQEIASVAQNGKIDENFIKLWLKDKAAGEDIARQLQARRIKADPIETGFIDTVLQSIYKVNKNAEEIATAAKSVDFNDMKQVTEFYRKFVKPKTSEWIDLLRYNSMLTSPNTHIINTASNFQGTGIITPIEKTLTGVLDATRSALTGSPRKYAVGEGASYAKGFYSSLGDASKRFIDVMQGKKPIGNPDIRQIPLATKGVKKVVEKTLNLPLRLLEGMDQFFKVATEGGLAKAETYAKSKGITRTGETASEEASRRLFRSGSSQQGYILNAIDGLTNAITHVRNSDNTILSTMAKFTLPFVKTPTELLKQGIEYSPMGISTLAGATNKTEQLSKALIGTASALGVSMLLGQDRLTWATPTGAKQKAEFLAAGRQPYSVKIGDKWVSYSKLHPAFAFNFALIAAIDDQMKQQRLSETDADSIRQAFAKYGNFIADQSYLKNIGDFVAGVKGDSGGFTKLISNYPQQLIPFRALSSWIERLTDPYQRQIDKDGTILNKQMQQLMLQIPGLGEKLPPKTGSLKQPLENKDRVLNAFSPVRVSEEDKFSESVYQLDQAKSKVDKFKTDLKSIISKELNFRIQ